MNVRVYGKAVHSSFALTNHGCNAIDYAAKIIVKIREFGEEFRKSGTHDKDYVVPHTTMSTNLIKGGNAVNTVPAECEFSFEFRNLPQDDAATIEKRVRSYVDDELLPAMKAECPGARIEFTVVGPVPPFAGNEEAAITKLVRKLTNDHAVHKAAGCTESGYFTGIAGVPTVVCGPLGDAIHCANEYVTRRVAPCHEGRVPRCPH
ncbi:glutamamyl carboxypeptidase [Trypanosoma grayi]|uniref:glutamamyl carboxypeptidase n=1 Tax=Trypanosoma grayi TaxID=71804 RepID=UPI0004F42482|nr:glutamamyl carboxypeptidase [Trypanosoma grayi]KEG05648.1 glutamamyl carboxypeptidase [Trypanosoma grayi]